MKKRVILNESEKRILSTIAKYRRPLTILELSKATGLSRPTVSKYIQSLKQKNMLKEI